MARIVHANREVFATGGLGFRGILRGSNSADPGVQMGQSRRFDPLSATSGLPRTTDIIGPHRHVSNVPKAEELIFGETTSP
jgi:hypothetical protein